MKLIAALIALSIACAPTGTAGAGGPLAGSVSAPDPAGATFRIEGDSVSLVNGRAERPSAPGSATKIVTMLSDKRATGDVDGDGRPDTIVVLINQPGGSGTFVYLAALLNPAGGAAATPAVLLGDRIVVNAVRLDARTVVVELLDRSTGQPLTSSPSVSTTRRFAVDRGSLTPQ